MWEMWIKCWLYSVINSASSLYVTIFYNFALVCDVFLADISHNLLEKVERCGGFSLPNSPPPPPKKKRPTGRNFDQFNKYRLRNLTLKINFKSSRLSSGISCENGNLTTVFEFHFLSFCDIDVRFQCVT